MATAFNRQAYELATARMHSAPAALTPEDLDMLATVSPSLVEQATQLRRAAMPRTATKSAKAERTQRLLEVMAKGIAPALKDALALRDARIAALEKRVDDLRLELEARDAARVVEHV
jgi:hypothetical protein